MHDNYSRKPEIRMGSNRAFGIVFVVVLVLVVAVQLIRNRELNWYLAAAAILLAAVAAARPVWLTLPNRAWSWFGVQLHKLVSPIILALLFTLLFVPLGFVLRLLRHTQLHAKPDPNAVTYWIDRQAESSGDMKRQF